MTSSFVIPCPQSGGDGCNPPGRSSPIHFVEERIDLIKSNRKAGAKKAGVFRLDKVPAEVLADERPGGRGITDTHFAVKVKSFLRFSAWTRSWWVFPLCFFCEAKKEKSGRRCKGNASTFSSANRCLHCRFHLPHFLFMSYFFFHEMKYDINKNEVYFLFFKKICFFFLIIYNRSGCYNFTDYSSEENI